MILRGLFRLGFCMQAWYFTSFFSCRWFSVWYNGHEIPLAGFIYAGRCAAAHCGDAGRPPAFCCSWIICLSLSLQNLFSLSLVGVLFRGRLFLSRFTSRPAIGGRRVGSLRRWRHVLHGGGRLAATPLKNSTRKA